MRQPNIIPRILLILAVVPFAFAVPVLVQEKRQTFVDEVHMPRDVKTVLGKRDDLRMMWSGLSHLEDDLGETSDHETPEGEQVHEPEVHTPQPQPNPEGAQGVHEPAAHTPQTQPNPEEAQAQVVHALLAAPPRIRPNVGLYVVVPEGHTPPPNAPYRYVPVVTVLAPPRRPVTTIPVPPPNLHVPPHDPADVGRDPIVLQPDFAAPPGSPGAESATESHSNSGH